MTAAVDDAICDCHVHFYGAPERYPLAPTNAYQPPLATVGAYRSVMERLGITHVVAVQPSAYGADNRCTLDAVAELGPCARAVMVVTPETSKADLRTLHDRGARGARFFFLRKKLLGWDDLEKIAPLLADLGWHAQLQFDGMEFAEREQIIARLPCTVVIDHNGKFLQPVTGDHPSMQALLRLLETGRCWVKASAPYETSRSGPPGYDDVGAIARRLIAAAPERVVWASNWPHGAQATKPDDLALLTLLSRWCPDTRTRRKILAENPAILYGFG
jgi:D-galactarolactone isomerase